MGAVLSLGVGASASISEARAPRIRSAVVMYPSKRIQAVPGTDEGPTPNPTVVERGQRGCTPMQW